MVLLDRTHQTTRCMVHITKAPCSDAYGMAEKPLCFIVVPKSYGRCFGWKNNNHIWFVVDKWMQLLSQYDKVFCNHLVSRSNFLFLSCLWYEHFYVAQLDYHPASRSHLMKKCCKSIGLFFLVELSTPVSCLVVVEQNQLVKSCAMTIYRISILLQNAKGHKRPKLQQESLSGITLQVILRCKGPPMNSTRMNTSTQIIWIKMDKSNFVLFLCLDELLF